ncbi:hypothetical protein WMF30_52750 [Sorangium sp. So ce134]
MSESTLLDNDVMIKVCCYALADEVCSLLAASGGTAAALEVTRFIVAKQINRKSRIKDKSSASAQFAQMCSHLTFIEPTEEEIALAAEIETQAQKQNLPLDRGESQILAVLLSSAAKLMLTGDKRAISAIEMLAREHERVQACQGRLACLEQLVVALLDRHGELYLRPRICREPSTDQSIAICFSCGASAAMVGNAREGLDSYIRAIRSQAPTVLCPTTDLSIFA